eukprot:12405256-Karenia_brevis.AAC.1
MKNGCQHRSKTCMQFEWLLLRYRANMASKRPPTWSRGGGVVLVKVSGLLLSWRLLEASWSPRGP